MPASRLTLGSLVALIALVLVSLPLSDLLQERFGGGDVVFRDWMVGVNGALAGAHGLALAALWLGLGSHPGSRVIRWALALGTMACLADALFPALLGPGPFSHGAWQMVVLRVLVFLPPFVRAVAWLGLAVSLSGGVWLGRGLIGAFALDSLWTLYVWADTPLAVMARLHASPTEGWVLGPWAVATATLIWTLRRPAGRADYVASPP